VHEYAQGVRSGTLDDPTFLPVIYAAHPDDDWTSPTTWAKANPGLGKIVREDYLAEQVNKARATPSLVNTFKRLHLNVWTGSVSTWLTDDDVQQGAHPIPWERLKGVPCWGGLDLASTRDLTAFALVWHLDGQTFALVHQFVNEETARGAKLTYGTDYMAWADAGHITVTPGNVTDFDAVRVHIEQAAERWNIQAINYDRKFSPYIVPQLIASGLRMEPFGQGFLSMNEPTKWLEMETVAGRLIHGANPVLRWQFSCVVLDRDAADNIKVAKNRGKVGHKVDGVVALVMACGGYLAEGRKPEPPDFTNILSL
jgi:phage terminase large subunit-like protein